MTKNEIRPLPFSLSMTGMLLSGRSIIATPAAFGSLVSFDTGGNRSKGLRPTREQLDTALQDNILGAMRGATDMSLGAIIRSMHGRNQAYEVLRMIDKMVKCGKVIMRKEGLSELYSCAQTKKINHSQGSPLRGYVIHRKPPKKS